MYIFSVCYINIFNYCFHAACTKLNNNYKQKCPHHSQFENARIHISCARLQQNSKLFYLCKTALHQSTSKNAFNSLICAMASKRFVAYAIGLMVLQF